MPLKMRLFTIFAVVSLIFATTTASASNRLYADNTLEPSDGLSFDFGFGLAYYIEDAYLAGIDTYGDGAEFNAMLSVAYDRAYLEFDNSQLSGNLVLGVSLVDKDDWGLDLMATNVQSGFDEDGTFYNDSGSEQLKGISKRQSDFSFGTRLTRKTRSSQLSLELLQDVSGSHHGWVSSLFISKIKQWRNLEWRAGIGVNVYSARFASYYFGVSEREATVTRPAYYPGVSYGAAFELHGEYPITENWVMLGGWMTTLFSPSISESPIIAQRYQHKAKIGVRYVF